MKIQRAIALVAIAGLVATMVLACRSTAETVQDDFRLVTNQVLPAIVKIDVVEILKDQSGPDRNGKPLFDYFFDDSEGSHPPQEFRQESLGSGILVRRMGDKLYVVTNAHVISDAQDITVTLDDGRVFPATLVGKDERKDLALIVFESTDSSIPLVRLGDSDALRVGDWALAMGAPYGFQSTVTAGIISALHRRGGPGGNINDFIQTDASINKGNSGGALVDIHGNVIGINTWITSQSGDSVGLGFSIPINNVKHAISDFIEAGKIRYGWLGVSVSSVDLDSAVSLGQSNDKGALVTSLYAGSPADMAGLKPGDVILAINGKALAGAEDLIQSVGELLVKETPDLLVQRGKSTIKIKPVIALREEDDNLAKHSQVLWPGFSLYPLTDQVRKDLELDAMVKGVIVRQVVNQSPAFFAGLKNRDIVEAIDEVQIDNMQQFYDELNKINRQNPLTISINREGKKLTLEIGGTQERQKKES